MNALKFVVMFFTALVLFSGFVFSQETYTLTIYIDPPNPPGGSVVKSPDKEAYDSGEEVTLTAIPNEGYEFDSWEGDASGTDPQATLVMDADKVVTAHFRSVKYVLTVYIDPPNPPGGSVTKEPNKQEYDAGEEVTLMAMPNEGYEFDHWSGHAAGTNPSTSVVMDGDKVVTAHFRPAVYQLTIYIDPPNPPGGYVTKAPNKQEYNAGEEVELTAIANEGYVFDSWSGDAAGNNPTVTMIMDADKVVTAHFYAVETHTIAIGIEPSGSGTVEKEPDKTLYNVGEQVTLTAEPDAGYEFDHWEGDAAGTEATVTITMDADKSVTAYFHELPTYTMTIAIEPDDGGSVSLEPDKVNFYAGEEVTLTAEPNEGYEFDQWSGDASGDNPIVILTMDSDKSVTAHFRLIDVVTVLFDADSTIGFAPLNTIFTNKSSGNINQYFWNFGDGTTSRSISPTHRYENVGVYTVSLTVQGPRGTATKTVENLIEVYDDSIHQGLATLKFIVGSNCWHESEGWMNAIDKDTYLWTGTTNAGRTIPWAIFSFADEMVYHINKIRMMTDTGVPQKQGDWVRKFKVHVSTAGYEDVDFVTIGEFINTTSKWNEFAVDPIPAKFIKLTIDEPSRGWRQVGEFEVYCDSLEIPDISGSTITATTPHYADGLDSCTVTILLKDNLGNPVTGFPGAAFGIEASGSGNMYGKIHEIDNSGIYQGKFVSTEVGEKTVIAHVFNQVIRYSSVENMTPVVVSFLAIGESQATLQFVFGTTCYEGEGWDNAIDGDIDGWDGTVSAGPKWHACYGIFEFANQLVKTMSKYRLITDTGVGHPKHWVTSYRLLASTTGMADGDFVLVHEHHRATGGWEEFTLDPVRAKYVKLVLLEPIQTWRQIGELEIFVRNTIPHSQEEVMNTTDLTHDLPLSYTLQQNYPNPFNAETVIRFELPEPAQVNVRIFNITGQEIVNLIDNKNQAGRYAIVWNGKDAGGVSVASGIYLYRIEAYNMTRYFVETRKMAFLK